jgi:hypothetical protein
VPTVPTEPTEPTQPTQPTETTANRTRRLLPAIAAALCAALAACSPDAGAGELVLLAEVRPQDATVEARSTATELTPEQGYDALGLSAPAAVSGNPEVPEPAAGVRRFAFVLTACAPDSARLRVTDRSLTAEPLRAGRPAPASSCGAPGRFLAVFDVPASDVPQDALVG